MPKVSSGLLWVWLSVIIVLVDQVVKFVVLAHLHPYQPIVLLPFFSLYLAFNRGAAFSLLSDAPGWQLWMFSLIAIVICIGIVVWLAKISIKQSWLCIALSMILGGALGNLVDRLSMGSVVDYFLVHVNQYAWPTFNMADSAITIGAIMLIIDAVFFKKQ